MTNHGILIAGAGPTGLTAAVELARRGIMPRIIDRKVDALPLSRAVGINGRSLTLLEKSGISSRLLAEGVYVIGFFFPVVPRGKARIRVQMSAAHDRAQLDKAIAAFIKVGKELEVI